jgi:hypothetical protein
MLEYSAAKQTKPSSHEGGFFVAPRSERNLIKKCVMLQ